MHFQTVRMSLYTPRLFGILYLGAEFGISHSKHYWARAYQYDHFFQQCYHQIFNIAHQMEDV